VQNARAQLLLLLLLLLLQVVAGFQPGAFNGQQQVALLQVGVAFFTRHRD
jgi:hypothetical protein